MRTKMDPRDKKISIIDVAKEAGVSTATVSRYMNVGIIKPKTALKVKKAIEKLNYVPSESARAIASTRTPKQIKIIISNIRDVKNAEIFTGVINIMNIYRYTPIIEFVDDNPKSLDEILEDVKNVRYIKRVVYIGPERRTSEDFDIICSVDHEVTDSYETGITMGRIATRELEVEAPKD